MTSIALIGHGKMGKEVEAAAKERGMKVARVFSGKNNIGGLGLNAESLRDVDVCIDFSVPAAVLDNIEAVAAAGRNIVVGTTGWYDKLESVRQLVKKTNIGLLYASNFSLGVNLFMNIAADAARLFDKYPGYDVAINEIHHNKKADAPSGTALSLGSVILQYFRKKTELLTHAPQGHIKSHQLHIAATRLGSVTGTHAVVFDSDSDTIELIHAAKNRRGFAMGALVAAEWLKGKKGLFTMKDVIHP